MRSMKKTAVRLIIFLIVSAMMLSIVSCKPNKDEHEHNYTKEVVAPTCTENGYTKYTCECGDTYRDSEIPAAHQMVEVYEKEPTCTEAGESAFHVCQLCGYIEGEKTVVPALGHLYDTTYEYPTATEAGSKTSICRTCGHEHVEVINALSVELPEASKLLAQLIGSIAVTLEANKGTELVYVTEIRAPEAESNGSKQVMFVEIAEAAVDSTGEVLKAHLKVKVGLAETELDGLVPSKDVAVNKENAEYAEISVFVNGDAISISVNGQNTEADMSDLLYDYVAQMMGVENREALQTLVENAYLVSELEAQLMPLIQKAIASLAEKVVTVDPAYAEYVAELFAVLGAEIMTVTTDNKTGNTTVSLNLAALKKLVAEVEGKTVAEYLETVYGKNVVASIASFLESMPDLTIKEIVNAAVNLAEGTGVTVESIYTLIDLYVYSVSGMEFSIESLIADNYNKTLVEILAEMNGITGSDKQAFIANVKSSFAQIAEVIQTISFEDILASFIPAEEGAFEAIKDMIDMLDEQIVYTVTVDAEGNLVSMHYAFAGIEYELEVLGEGMSRITAVLPDGSRMLVNLYADGFGIRVMDVFGTLVASIDFSDTLEVVGEDFVSTCVLSVRDEMNELLNYKVVTVNDVVTEFQVALRNYVFILGEGYYDPELDEWFYPESEPELVTVLAIDYKDLGEEKHLLVNVENTTLAIYITENGLSLSVLEGDEQVAYGVLTINTETVGEDVIERVSAFLSDGTNDLLIYNTVSVNGVVTDAYAAVKGYFVYTEHNHEIAQPEYEYETKPMPEGGFATDEMPEGSEIIVVVPGYSCENCVTIEEYVTWLEILYTTNDDGTKVLEVNAHDELNNMSEGMDRLTVVIDGDKITAVIGKDDEDLGLFEITTTETTIVGTVTDIQDGANNVMAEFELELTEALDAIKNVSLIVRDYEYDYTEEGEPIKTIVEIFNGAYEWIDNTEGADYIVVEIDGVKVQLGYEVTEDGAVTVDVLFEVFGQTAIDGAVTVSATENAITIAIDLDHLLISAGEYSTDYIEFEGALQIKVG